MADIDIEASLYYYYLKPMLKYAYVYLCVDIRVDREGNRMNPNKLKYSIIFMLFLVLPYWLVRIRLLVR